MVSNMEEVFRRLAAEQKGSAVDALNGIVSELGTKMKQIQCERFIVDSTRETMEVLDIAGYNYAEDRYKQDSGEFDNWISVGSETFARDLAKNWNLVQKTGNVIGDYVWTSWDYLGEAGIGRNVYDRALETGGISAAYPWFIAYCGDFDIIGSRRPQSYYREIVIGQRLKPYIGVSKPEHYGRKPFDASWSWSDTVASWNWEGFEGKPIQVEVYAIADEVELFVNGRSAGRKGVLQENSEREIAYRILFDTVYEPGELEAVSYVNGKETGRCLLETADKAVELTLEADREEIPTDEGSLSYLSIGFADSRGRAHWNVFSPVTVKVEGPGTLQGLGSANPCGREDFFESTSSAYYGELLAVVRPTGKGTIKVEISAEGCGTVTREIRAF